MEGRPNNGRSEGPESGRKLVLKARDPNPARSLEVCLGLGAEDRGQTHQTDTYLGVKQGRLKLREENGTAELIYYERTSEGRVRDGLHRATQVVHADTLKDALVAKWGIMVVVEKSRRRLLWRDIRIHLDDVRQLGSFIALEALATANCACELALERRNLGELFDAVAITPDRVLAGGYIDEMLRDTQR
jgi:adenylate cyclase, class 2